MATVKIEKFCGLQPRVNAAMLADGIQRGVNAPADETAATVAKYATLTHEMAELAKNISAMLTDGRIDNMERDTLQKMLEPMFAKVMELV